MGRRDGVMSYCSSTRRLFEVVWPGFVIEKGKVWTKKGHFYWILIPSQQVCSIPEIL